MNLRNYKPTTRFSPEEPWCLPSPKSFSPKDQYVDEEDYAYDPSDETYYDGEFENSTDYNYSYSYNYEEETELNYIPELITRPQRIVVRQGETAELPCEANVTMEI